jgi:hypothetical protein
VSILYINKKIGCIVNMADNDNVNVMLAQEESDNGSEEEDIDYVPELTRLSRKEASSSEDESSEDDCDCGDEPPSYVVIPSVSKLGQSVSSTLVDAVPYSSRSNTVLGKNQTEWSGRPISANLEPKIIRRGYGKLDILSLVIQN